jgi:predicted short-subunit dehydrogenase-like oxidoreductase (DUF2520 family)
LYYDFDNPTKNDYTRTPIIIVQYLVYINCLSFKSQTNYILHEIVFLFEVKDNLIMSERPTLAFIGAGRVGSTLAQTLYWRGYIIKAVYSRTAESAGHLAGTVSSKARTTVADAARSADLIFITVPDDAIESVCAELAQDPDLHGKAIVHTSGASGMAVLQTAKDRGAWVGGLHPMLSIMDRQLSPGIAFSVPWVTESPDVTFGVEAEFEPLRTWLADIIKALNGIPLWLRAGQDRARYHAAGVFASNYVVTLFAEAMGLLQTLQTDPEMDDERVLRQIIVHLLEKTLANLKTTSPQQALTGPIVRGDVGTIRKHLDALDAHDSELADLYRVLTRRTLRLAAERGTPLEKLDAIRASLNRASLTLSDAVQRTGGNNANINSDHSKDED